MQARDVMTKPVITATPDTDIRTIAAIMMEKQIGGLPVLDSSGVVIGIVTEGDLLRLKAPDEQKIHDWRLTLLLDPKTHAKPLLEKLEANLTARDVMSAPVMTVPDGAEVLEICKMFVDTGIKRVPVTREGRLIGIVSRSDIIARIAQMKPEPPQGEGIFGWTLHLDPFDRDKDRTPPPPPAPEPRPDAVVTAADFRLIAQDAAAKKMRQRAIQDHVKSDDRMARVKQLIDTHLSEDEWLTVLQRSRDAAERGEREYLVLQFPAELCSDGGRAINVGEPGWPATLRGEAAETFLRYERTLKDRGFHMIARVLSFPNGYLGDIGLFLHWGGIMD
ncbi:putative transcriptional regulator, XRE family [Rhodomicrobium vannielii ATCC 17100]|uniref:Putative transcriptional regulator, XRE family n=1 Tax=Rhodomicrobium vannielii (strain ATCC 17100 / DSM 162 / LMG 4299 / NCIMB 10020 / ATH 3.1.1) TaxID=648757 RepID=E3I7G0_RHOVT|nr:CBS domain-containing protein [Rhodomicrobium vannielii]ADP71879.1 putative transcriptional regulator, XRE family [Rhodomicrobium vannielii ATCC 17100]